mmetsp:Transcript_17037/g.16261  ORF Transcript_17037/g.16261 Transcript_17037/m.16261 type:complete len:137 (+) Transcript_17037:480-890(+)
MEIEPIVNECFSYLLKKNKKYMSKRNLKKVMKRHFKDLFFDVMFGVPQKIISQYQETEECVESEVQQEIDTIPREETLGGGRLANMPTTVTHYPDSLEGRSLHNKLTMRSGKHTYINESSMNYLPSRSKSMEKSIN